MSEKIQLRHGTAALAAAVNPILAPGEPAVAIDGTARVLKIGDGLTAWQDLLPVGGGGSGGTAYTDEQVRDVVAALLQAGVGVTITNNDAADTLTISASVYTDEQVRDAIAAALRGGTNVTITTDDAADTITIAAATDPEVVRDTIGSTLVAGANVTITVDDASNTITIAAAGSTGGGGSGRGNAQYIVASVTASAAEKAGADYVCDGVADEVQINAALALGNVQLTDGDFTISSAIKLIRPGSALIGTGYGHTMASTGVGRGFGTLIKGTTGFTDPAFIMIQQPTDVYPMGQCQVRNLTIDGAAPTAVVDGLIIRSYQFHVSDLVIQNMTGNGMNIHGYSSTPGPQWDTYDGKVSSCLLSYNNVGLQLGNNSADLHIWNCIINYNTNEGIKVTGGASAQISSVHLYSNLHGIHFISGGSRTKLSNCKIENQYQHGIFFDGTSAGTSGVQIVGCGFNSNGRATHNTYDHISVSGTQQTTKLQIIGCQFSNSYNLANLARYAINLSLYAVSTTITGCYFGNQLSTTGVGTGKVNVGNSTVKAGLMAVGNNGFKDLRGSATPTAAAGSGAGATPPVPVVHADSMDYKGRITCGTGTGSVSTSASVVDVVFANPWEYVGQRIVLTPSNAAAALAHPYVQAISLTGFSIGFATALASSQPNTTYSVDYAVVS